MCVKNKNNGCTYCSTKQSERRKFRKLGINPSPPLKKLSTTKTKIKHCPLCWIGIKDHTQHTIRIQSEPQSPSVKTFSRLHAVTESRSPSKMKYASYTGKAPSFNDLPTKLKVCVVLTVSLLIALVSVGAAIVATSLTMGSDSTWLLNQNYNG